MTTSNQLTPGMVIVVGESLYRVDAATRVAPPKGASFMKTTLVNLQTGKKSQKNFKTGQKIHVASKEEKELTYLYVEGKDYLFLDCADLDQVAVNPTVMGAKARYLKQGVPIKATAFEGVVCAVDLPQFMELTVVEVEGEGGEEDAGGATHTAVLETGATVEVPHFVSVGDIIRVDTLGEEFVQRV